MSSKDWLPKNHEGIYDMAVILVAYLTPAKLDAIGIAGEALAWYNNEFLVKYTDFEAAFNAWKDPAERTKNKIAVLERDEKSFVEMYRALYTGYIKNNPLVSNVELVDMGFPQRHEGGGTPSKPPTEFVEPSIILTGPAIITIEYRVKGEENRGKPKNCHGMELRWAILDQMPVDWTALTNSVFDTASPMQLTFEGEQRSKTLFFACRWENNIGQKGPWSEIFSVIIP
jgi:hypothetical protein